MHHPAEHIFLAPKSQPKEIVFLGGAPGAGKGTNSVLVSSLRGFDAPPIVVSDLLNTPACKLMKDQGVMVNDEFVFNALLKELEKPIYKNGVVVDGFPRTAKQAEFLAEQYNDSPASPQVSFVMLHVDEDASIRRQQERGKATMAQNKTRAKKNMSPLEVRATDMSLEASKTRYDVFKEQLNAVMGLSRQFPLVVVDATPSLDIVRSSLTEQMAALPRPRRKSLPRFPF
jgi:adenylate kinase